MMAPLSGRPEGQVQVESGLKKPLGGAESSLKHFLAGKMTIFGKRIHTQCFDAGWGQVHQVTLGCRNARGSNSYVQSLLTSPTSNFWCHFFNKYVFI